MDSNAPDGPRDVLVEVALDDLGRKPHAIGDDLAWEEVQSDVEMMREDEMDGVNRLLVTTMRSRVTRLASCRRGRQEEYQYGHSPQPAGPKCRGHGERDKTLVTRLFGPGPDGTVRNLLQ